MLGLAVASGRPGGAMLLAAAIAAVAVSALALRSTGRARASSSDFLVDLAFAVLLIGVLLITFNGVRLAEGVALADAALAASAIVTGLAVAFGAVHVLAPRWLIFAAGGILTAGVVSAVLAEELAPNLLPAVRFAFALAVMPILVGALSGNRSRRDLVVVVWIASATINALVALADFAGFTEISAQIYLGNTSGRLNGLTAHPNHLGLVCAMALPVTVWALLHRRRGLSRLPFLPPVIVLLGGILVSGSRAALVGAIAGCALLLLLAANRGRAAIGVFVLGGAATFVVGTLTSDQPSTSTSLLTRLGDETSTAQSDEGRLEAFRTAVDVFQSNPVFGGGFEDVLGAHDIYLQMLQAGGLVGLVAFGFFCVGILRLGNAMRRSVRLTPQQRELATALLAAVGTWFVIGLTQNALYDRFLYLPVGLVLGLAVAHAAAARAAGRAPA